MERIDQFKGFCSTPSIFPKDTGFPYQSFSFPQITEAPNLIRDLAKLSHPRNSILGKRMESYFELAIQYSSRYELISSNIQIINKGRTLGELDFLVKDLEFNKIIHVELIYKLYLLDKNHPEIGWIGPNRRDSFLKKLNKLEKHQFPLLYEPATRSYLKDLDLDISKIEQQVCFKAKLFSSDPISKLNQVNPNCYSGNWMRLERFNSQTEQGLYYSPRKQDWSCDPRLNQTWFTPEEIKPQINELCHNKRSPLLWKKSESGYESFFVVWW